MSTKTKSLRALRDEIQKTRELLEKRIASIQKRAKQDVMTEEKITKGMSSLAVEEEDIKRLIASAQDQSQDNIASLKEQLLKYKEQTSTAAKEKETLRAALQSKIDDLVRQVERKDEALKAPKRQAKTSKESEPSAAKSDREVDPVKPADTVAAAENFLVDPTSAVESDVHKVVGKIGVLVSNLDNIVIPISYDAGKEEEFLHFLKIPPVPKDNTCDCKNITLVQGKTTDFRNLSVTGPNAVDEVQRFCAGLKITPLFLKNIKTCLEATLKTRGSLYRALNALQRQNVSKTYRYIDQLSNLLSSKTRAENPIVTENWNRHLCHKLLHVF